VRGNNRPENRPGALVPPKGPLASKKIGSAFSYTGKRTDKENSGFGLDTITTTYQANGRFPTARSATGSLKISVDHTGDGSSNPNYFVPPYHCERTVSFSLTNRG
jgi:hypothetical protein